MALIITDREIRSWVIDMLGSFSDDYDVPAIVAEIISTYGRVEADYFTDPDDQINLHNLIARHDRTVQR